MELEQKSMPLSSNTTEEEDHITWSLSFEKTAEQMTLQILCSTTKVNKALPDIPVCICDSTFYQMSLKVSSKDPVQTCGLTPFTCMPSKAPYRTMAHSTTLQTQPPIKSLLKETQATSTPNLFLKLSFSFVTGEIFLLFPCFLWWSHTANQDLPPAKGKS